MDSEMFPFACENLWFFCNIPVPFSVSVLMSVCLGAISTYLLLLYTLNERYLLAFSFHQGMYHSDSRWSRYLTCLTAKQTDKILGRNLLKLHVTRGKVIWFTTGQVDEREEAF